MIPIELTFIAFFALAIYTSSRTYFILALFSLLNVYVYPYTSSSDVSLLDIYASIDFFTCVAVLLFGDIHKVYQSIILTVMVLLHGLMEFALQADFYYEVTTNLYINAITALLIAQMMGVFRGSDRIYNPISHFWKVRRPSGFDNR